jgi:hypothetical protein
MQTLVRSLPCFITPNYLFDNRRKIVFPMPLLGMKTAFSKQVKLAPAYGHTMSIWTRVSCHFGSVGTKF